MNESSFIFRLQQIDRKKQKVRFRNRINNLLGDQRSCEEIKCGGEDRTRTCKRSLAVVFKTTALPIRLPLRLSRARNLNEHRRSTANKKYILKCFRKQPVLRCKKARLYPYSRVQGVKRKTQGGNLFVKQTRNLRVYIRCFIETMCPVSDLAVAPDQKMCGKTDVHPSAAVHICEF